MNLSKPLSFAALIVFVISPQQILVAKEVPGLPAKEKQLPNGLSLFWKARESVAAFDFDTAEKFAEQAVERTLAENGGREEIAVGLAMAEWGRIQFRQERYDKAAGTLGKAVSIFVKKMGAGSSFVHDLMPLHLQATFRSGDFAGAVKNADVMIGRLGPQGAGADGSIAEVERIKGESLLALGRLDEAQKVFFSARDRAERSLGDNSAEFAKAQEALEALRRKQGEKVTPLFVGSLSNSSKLIFEGNDSFPAKKLSRGLLGHAAFFLASHPYRRLEDFLNEARTALVAGYKKAGFLDVKVSVEYDVDADVVRARIVEGVGIRRGELRIEGLDEIDPIAFHNALTSGDQEPDKEADELTKIEEALGKKLPTTTGVLGPAEGQGIKGNLDVDVDAGVDLGVGEEKPPIPFSTKPEPIWTEGKPAEFAPQTENTLRWNLASHFFAFGHPQAKFEIERVPNPVTGRIDLEVRVEDEGPPCVLGELEVTGSEKNKAADILVFLGLEAGQRLFPDTLRKAKLGLWNCGRFRHFEITATPRGPGRPEIDVVIKVVELSLAPPLTEPLAPELEALIGVARMLSSSDLGGNDLVIRESGAQTARGFFLPPEEGGIAPADDEFLEIAISSAGEFVMQLAGDRWKGGSPFMVSFGGNDDFLNIVIRLGNFPLSWRVPIKGKSGGQIKGLLALLIDPELNEKGKETSSISFSFGTSTKGDGSPFKMNLTVAPAAILLKGLGDPLSVETVGGVMTIESEALGKLQIEEELGRLIRWTRGESGVSLEPDVAKRIGGEVDAAWDAIPAAQRLETGFMTWAMGIMASTYSMMILEEDPGKHFAGELSDDQKKLVLAQFKLIRVFDTTLQRAGKAVFGKAGDEGDGESAFSVPVDPAAILSENGLYAWVGSLVISYVDTSLPPDSWLSKFIREVAFVMAGQTSTSNRVFDEIATDLSVGPVGCLFAASVLKQIGHPAAVKFAVRASVLTRKEDFRRDWKLFTDIDWFGRDLVYRILDQVSALTPDEIAAISGLIPENIGRRLVANTFAFGTKGENPTGEFIGTVMDAAWEGGLAEKVQGAVRTMLRPPTKTQPE